MKKRRGRLEIIRDILRTVSQKHEIGPTKLLQKSNLSPQVFREYIGELEKKGFLRKIIHKNHKLFQITAKGMSFLEQYRTIERFIEGFGL